MGQKVNPIGLRTGINKDWNSKWYASKKDFATYLNKDIKIRKYLSTKLKDAAVSNVVIERNPKKTEINIYQIATEIGISKFRNNGRNNSEHE